MSIYHLHTYAISRKSMLGSAVHAAAYRSGEALVQYSTAVGSAREIARVKKAGQDHAVKHDYTQRFGVVSADLIFPYGGDFAPELGREPLWNMSEAMNHRSNSRMAREFRLGLPSELSAEQRHDLAMDFATQLVEWYGLVADVAIHLPSEHGDQRNHHAHILTTTNVWRDGCLQEKTDLELSNSDCLARGVEPSAVQITKVRQMAERTINRHLEMAGMPNRVDCRSYAAQECPVRPFKSFNIAELHSERAKPSNETDLRADSVAKQLKTNLDFIKSNPTWLTKRCLNDNGEINPTYLAKSLENYVPADSDCFSEILLELTAAEPIEEADALPTASKPEPDEAIIENSHTSNAVKRVIDDQCAPYFDRSAFVKKVEEQLTELSTPLYVALHQLRFDMSPESAQNLSSLPAQLSECFDREGLMKQAQLIANAAVKFNETDADIRKAHPDLTVLGQALRTLLLKLIEAERLSIEMEKLEKSELEESSNPEFVTNCTIGMAA
jgi:hypothetical protein